MRHLGTVEVDARCCNCPTTTGELVSFDLQSGHIAYLCGDCVYEFKWPYVYFVVGGDLVKIGHSTDIEQRLAAHQISSPVPLQLWHLVRGSRQLEHELHKRFAADRAHGEWFHISDAIRAYVRGET